MSERRFSLPDPGATISSIVTFCRRIKEIAERREGSRQMVSPGDLDRFVSLQELKDFGYGTSHFTVYREKYVSALSMTLLGASDPALTQIGSTGTYAYGFDAATSEELIFNVTLPDDYKEGSNILPIVHWCPVSTNTGMVRWGLDYTWANDKAVFQAAQTIYGLSVGPGYTNMHKRFPLQEIYGGGKRVGSILSGRAWRNGGHGHDNYNADALLLGVGFIYPVSSMGSRTSLRK